MSGIAAAFDHPSVGYGTGNDFHARYARSLVAHTGCLRPGELVLDVATGTAPAAIAAAATVGLHGLVVGIDIASGMLAQARQNITECDARISLLCADGARLPFRDACFDVVMCSSSLVWFPDIPAALHEWARITKPGGRLAFSCLSSSALPLGSLFRTHLASYGVMFPDLNEPLVTPEKCRQALRVVGYTPDAVYFQQYGSVVKTVADAWAASGGQLLKSSEESDEWQTLQRSPVSLWAHVRLGRPIAVPLREDQLDQLKRDYLEEVASLANGATTSNPLTTMIVTAHLQK